MQKTTSTILLTESNIAYDHYQYDRNIGYTLVFVGFSSSKERNAYLADALYRYAKTNVAIVDFTGHGESSGELEATRPCEHIQQAVAIYDTINATIGSCTSVFGTSYGGYIAAHLARYRPIDTLVLRTPALYPDDLLYTQHQLIDKQAMRTYRSCPEKIAQNTIFKPINLPRKTVVIKHSNDDSVPAETIDAYVTSHSAQLVVAHGYQHAYRHPSNPQTAHAAERYFKAIYST